MDDGFREAGQGVKKERFRHAPKTEDRLIALKRTAFFDPFSNVGQWRTREGALIRMEEEGRRKEGGKGEMDPMSAVMPNPVRGTATQSRPSHSLWRTLSLSPSLSSYTPPSHSLR